MVIYHSFNPNLFWFYVLYVATLSPFRLGNYMCVKRRKDDDDKRDNEPGLIKLRRDSLIDNLTKTMQRCVRIINALIR